MRGLVCVLIVLLAFACNGGGDGLRTATPTAPPSTTPAPSPATTPAAMHTVAPEITYIDHDTWDIWLVAADGSSEQNLSDGRCPRSSRSFWSPDGSRIACIGWIADQTRVVVFDPSGALVLQIDHAASPAEPFVLSMTGAPPEVWSPDGEFLAYVVVERPPKAQDRPETGVHMIYIAHKARGVVASIRDAQELHWSPDGSKLAYFHASDGSLAVYDMATGEEKVLAQGLRPLAWVKGGQGLLVASHYREEGLFPTYTANLLDPATGEMKRVSELDDGTQFWLSPDGETAAVASREDGSRYLGVLNLSSLQFTPIAGSPIRYRTEMISWEQVAFSRDGSRIYWADSVGPDSTLIYAVNSDGSDLIKVGEVPGAHEAFSPDLRRVLYTVAPLTEPKLWVANIDGSDARMVAGWVAWPATWRPSPTP
jgi:Tol biopolymer transport system component